MPVAERIIDQQAFPDAGQPAELSELLRTFNDVTGRLSATHEKLTRQVGGLQEELRAANEQLERSRRLSALGEMAAGIAHEVRNPLGSIGLYARMLASDLADRPAERQLATKILSAVRGLDAIVEDVLAFSREQRARPIRCDAGSLISAAVETCCPAEARTGRPRVVRQDLRQEPIAVDADPLLMQCALSNVVRNALEAMAECPPPPAMEGEAGAHILRLGARRTRSRGPAGRVVPMVGLLVEDTGPGVDEALIERMFNPFFTTRPTGTGLGLAIVNRLMEAHGGRVVVRSRRARPDDPEAPPRGTVVELLLPASGVMADRGQGIQVAGNASRQEAAA